MRKIIMFTLAAAALAGAGCGSSDDGGDGTASARGADDDKQLAFARCMRGEGIDMPDPKPAGSGPVRQRFKGRGMSPAKLEAATEKCRKETGGGPPELSDAQVTELQDKALAFARCMRGHGIDVPDPKITGNGGVVIQRDRGGRTRMPDIDSPAFRRAEEACRKYLPRIGEDG